MTKTFSISLIAIVSILAASCGGEAIDPSPGDVSEVQQPLACSLELVGVGYTDFSTWQTGPLSQVKMKLRNNGTTSCSYKACFWGKYFDYPYWIVDETDATASANLPAGATTAWITQYLFIETNGAGAEDCYYRPQAKFNGVWQDWGDFACE